MPLNLVMLGAPGAGKGTQAARVAAARGLPHISTGDMLRQAVQEGTPIGRTAKAIMDRGELVGDEVIIEVVRERLSRPDAKGGFVLDGFPRTIAQARALDGLVEGRGALIIADVVVPEAELVRRLGSRFICAACGTNASPEDAGRGRCGKCGGQLVQRADDDENVVRERLRVYEQQTAPLVDYYRSRPTFCTIDGAQSPDQVAGDLASAIDRVAMSGARP